MFWASSSDFSPPKWPKSGFGPRLMVSRLTFWGYSSTLWVSKKQFRGPFFFLSPPGTSFCTPQVIEALCFTMIVPAYFKFVAKTVTNCHIHRKALTLLLHTGFVVYFGIHFIPLTNIPSKYIAQIH